MSGIDVQLGKVGEDNAGVFHDWRYTNDKGGGNDNQTTLEVMNESGNEIFIEGCILEQDPRTKLWERRWFDLTSGQGLDGLRIHIQGGAESYDFLAMLRLILNAEKMHEIIKP
jgi:hypothetical protein